MNKAMKVLSIRDLWRSPCSINNGDVVEVSWCPSGARYVFLGTDGETLKDHKGRIMWMDQDDIDSEYIVEFSPIDLDKNVLNTEFSQSKNVKSVTYFKKEKLLIVAFLKGGLYLYLDVPYQVYVDCTESNSVGTFVAGTIKPNYVVQKIV